MSADLKKTLTDLVASICYCMQQAINENPEEAKTWTNEELFEKGSLWAGRHVKISELPEPVPLVDGENPPAEKLMCKTHNVNGRVEHEAILRDSKRCKELGVDQIYETMIYLKRWGGWLNDP